MRFFGEGYCCKFTFVLWLALMRDIRNRSAYFSFVNAELVKTMYNLTSEALCRLFLF